MKTKSILRGIGLPALLLLISLMFGLPRASYGQEVISNGGFEVWTSVLPDGWTTSGVAEFSKETSTVKTGSNSMKVVSSAGTAKILQNGITTNIVAGEQYTLDFYYQATTAAGINTFRVWSSWLDADGEVITTGTGKNLQLPSANTYYAKTDGSWQNITTTVTAPAEAVKLNWEFRVYKGCTLYLDDVSFVKAASNQVATPTFSLPSQTIYGSTNVALACTTEGATIRYTTDSSTPTDASTEYINPITVSATTTVKAIAYKADMTTSAVATATYTMGTVTEVANIAAFKATSVITSPNVYKITGDVIFVHRDGKNIYVQDATGGLLIYDNASVITGTYNNGDVIKGGVYGSLTVYNGLNELIPVKDLAVGAPGTAVTPTEVTMSTLITNFADYESKLMKLTNVAFAVGTFTAQGATANIAITQGESEMICRNQYGQLTDMVAPTVASDVVGFAIPFNASKQIAPRTQSDITPYVAPFDGVFANVADLKANLVNWTKGDKTAGLSLAGIEVTCNGMTGIFVRDASGFMAIPYSLQVAPPQVAIGDIVTVTFGVTVTGGVAKINVTRQDNPKYEKTGTVSTPYVGMELTLAELKTNPTNHIGELVLLKNVVISGEVNDWKVSKDGSEFSLIGNTEDKAYADATVTGVFVNAQDGINATKIVDNTPAPATPDVEFMVNGVAKTEYDFGIAPVGSDLGSYSPVNLKFNNGLKPATIKYTITPNEGAIYVYDDGVKWTNTMREAMPSSAAYELLVSFAPEEVGDYTATMTITSADGQTTYGTLNLKGKCEDIEVEKGIVFKAGGPPPSPIENLDFETINVSAKSEITVYVDDKNENLEGNVIFTIDKGESAEGVFYLVGENGEKIYTETIAADNLMYYINVGFEPTGVGDFAATVVAKDETGDVEYGRLPLTGKGVLPTTFATLAELNAYLKVAKAVEGLTFTGEVEVVASNGQGTFYVRDDSAVSNAFMLDEMEAGIGWAISNFTFNIMNLERAFVYLTAGTEAEANPPYEGKIVTFEQLKNSSTTYINHLVVIEGVNVIVDNGKHYVVKGADKIIVNQDNLFASSQGSLKADETWTNVSVTGIFLGLGNDDGIMPRDRADFKSPAPVGPVITSTLPASIPAGVATEFTLTFSNVGEAAADKMLTFVTFDKKKADLYYKLNEEWVNITSSLSCSFQEGSVVNMKIIPTTTEGQTLTFDVKTAFAAPVITTLSVAYTTSGTVPLLAFVPSEDLKIGQFGAEFEMGDIVVGGSAVTKTFEVTVKDLTADVTMKLQKEGDNATEGLSFSPSSIAQSTNGSVTITVTYEPTSGPATFYLRDEIIFYGGGLVKNQTISIKGNVTNPAAPVANFEETSLDFGDVNIGESKTLTTTITTKNTTMPVNIKLNDYSKVFSVTPTTIAASISEVETTVTVVFTPKFDPYDLFFNGSIEVSSDEMDMTTCSISGTGVDNDTEPSVTLDIESWDGGYTAIGELEYANWGPQFEVVLKNIDEDVNITVEPSTVFFLELYDDEQPVIAAGKTVANLSIKYNNAIIGENKAKLVLTGATSGTKYATADMLVVGIDTSVPITVNGIAALKKYALSDGLKLADITLNPLNEDSPITITGNNGFNILYIQDSEAAYSIMDSGDWEAETDPFIISTAKVGDVLSNVKMELDDTFNIIAMPTVAIGTPIEAEPVTIVELENNQYQYDYKLVIINNVKYNPGNPSQWVPASITDADGNEIQCDSKVFEYEHPTASDNVNIRGIFFPGSMMSRFSIAPRNAEDFITPSTAKLESTLASSIPAGEATEFDLAFTSGDALYDNLSFTLEATNGKTMFLEQYNAVEEMWTEVDLSWGNSAIVSVDKFESMTIKFRITPLSTVDNSLKFTAATYHQDNDITLATVTSAYTTTGTVPMVTVSESSLAFGDVEMTKSKAMTFTVTPKDITSALTIELTDSAIESGSFAVSPATIAMGTTAATTVTVTFTPKAGENYMGAVRIKDGGLMRPTLVTLSGNGFDPSTPRIEVSVKELAFGDVAIGTVKEMTFTVTPHNLTKLIALSSSEPAFTVTPIYIEPNANVTTVTVKFTPTKVAEYESTLFVSGGDFGEYEGVNIGLFGKGTGTGIPTINITPAKLAFSAVFPGEPVEQSVMVDANDLSADMAIAISGDNAALFTFDAQYMDNRTGGMLYITYTPNALGTHSATLTITAGAIVKTVALSGTATSTNTPVITLSAVKLDFTSSANVPSAAQTLTVTTAHIVDGMDVVIEGANAAMFTRTFDGWSNKTGGNINVVYTPTATGTHTATLKITSGAVVKTVTLNGTAADVTPTITVAPETLTQFQAVVGIASAAQTVTVTAANLTADMAVTITGTNAAMFAKTTGTGWSNKTGGEISIVYTPTAEGTHTATLTITSGSITKTITLNGKGTTGVNELEDSTNIFAYNKTITVELEDINNANITVFDIAGKLVAEKSVDSNVTKIDVNSNAGIYIVRVTANGNTVAKKVVIK